MASDESIDNGLREIYSGGREPLPPADAVDPVIEAYKKDVDRTLLRENLKLTSEQRSLKFERNMELVWELRRAGERLRVAEKAKL